MVPPDRFFSSSRCDSIVKEHDLNVIYEGLRIFEINLVELSVIAVCDDTAILFLSVCSSSVWIL